MKKLLSVLLTLIMVASLLPASIVLAEETQEEQPIFPDLNVYAWYYRGVEYVVENNILSGTGKYFEPNKPMSRAMLVTAMYRLSGETAVGENPFVDVPDGTWYTDAVIWGNANGVISGIDKTHFAPDVNLTREQLAVIIHRYAKLRGADNTKNYSMLEFYLDQDQMSDYAKPSIDFMIKEGFMTGLDRDYFGPKEKTTRAEVSLVITLFAKSLEKRGL